MRTSSSERDYIFGSAMLQLRTAISLKQVELANLLGISRLAVGKWEGGINYPKAEHLKKVIALGVKNQAFPAGREAEEIRALWKAAHQKVLLDEDWLSMLLSQPLSPQGQSYGPLHTVVARNSEPFPSKSTMQSPLAGEIKTPANRCKKMGERRRWLMSILLTLVVITIIQFGRSAFFPGKR